MTLNSSLPSQDEAMSPHTIVFWRHLVGIAIVLVAQHPRLYEGGMMFLGLWLGTLIISLAGAGIATGLGYLFLTNRLRGKLWRVLIVFAWLIAGLQLFGEWALPGVMQRIAETPKDSLAQSGARDRDPAAIHARDAKRLEELSAKKFLTDAEMSELTSRSKRQEDKLSVLNGRSQSANFDFSGARKAGATDAEIVDYLQANHSEWFDFNAALRAGASPTQIVEFLIKQDGKTRQSKP
jgi:hypothetical protein